MEYTYTNRYYTGYTYTKSFLVAYLKFKLNWASWVFYCW